MITVKEGDEVLLKCDSWKKCYNGYDGEKHYFYYVDEITRLRRPCIPDNCINFGDGSRLIEYNNYNFGLYIKNISIIKNPTGLYWCRIQDSVTRKWFNQKTFNVVIE